jgi:hypothetical protein
MVTICITGMHRTGTSMVARMLNLSGLYLGEEDDILPAGLHNPEGYWENRNFLAINDGVLNELGAGWDFPPELQVGWESNPTLVPWKTKAATLVKQFSMRSFWGWKDPRNSLIMPFWQGLIPNMRVIICIRSPWEAASSLYQRNHFSHPSSYYLWHIYYRSLLSALKLEDRLVTHYDKYFQEPKAELGRILDWLGIKVPDHKIERAVAAVSISLRHYWAGTIDLARTPPPEDVQSLYEDLCGEAGLATHENQTAGAPIQQPAYVNVHTERTGNIEIVRAQERRTHQLAIQAAKKTAIMNEKDRAIQALTAQVNQKETLLREIFRSKAWRLVTFLRRVLYGKNPARSR